MLPQRDVAAHFGQVAGADHGADDGAVQQRVTHADALGTCNKLVNKTGVNAALNKDAAARCTALAVVGKNHEEGGVQSAWQVGIVEHHKGAFATQLHAEFFQPRRLHDAVARGRAAREGDGTHIRVPAQRLTRFTACAMHDVQHPCGDASLHGQLTQTRGAQG